MVEYGSSNLLKKKETRQPPIVIFGIVFGEESHLDYEPNSIKNFKTIFPNLKKVNNSINLST